MAALCSRRGVGDADYRVLATRNGLDVGNPALPHPQGNAFVQRLAMDLHVLALRISVKGSSREGFSYACRGCLTRGDGRAMATCATLPAGRNLAGETSAANLHLHHGQEAHRPSRRRPLVASGIAPQHKQTGQESPLARCTCDTPAQISPEFNGSAPNRMQIRPFKHFAHPRHQIRPPLQPAKPSPGAALLAPPPVLHGPVPNEQLPIYQATRTWHGGDDKDHSLSAKSLILNEPNRT